MNIQALEIKNFRCFKQIRSTFEEDLTVFVAKNGQGKSSILDAIKIALWPYVSGFDLGKQTNLPTDIEVSDVFRLEAETKNMEPVLFMEHLSPFIQHASCALLPTCLN